MSTLTAALAAIALKCAALCCVRLAREITDSASLSSSAVAVVAVFDFARLPLYNNNNNNNSNNNSSNSHKEHQMITTIKTQRQSMQLVVNILR